MYRHFTGLAVLSVCLLLSLTVGAQPVGADEPGSVTAVDILLDPDATMIEHAASPTNVCAKASPKASLWVKSITRTFRFCSGMSERRDLGQSLRRRWQSPGRGEAES